MRFNLSTRWNAGRHRCGQKMVEEALELGFDGVELGYNLTQDLVPGVRKMIDERALRVDSVHNYCPVPVGAPYGHPELFTLTNSDERIRHNAVWHIGQTLRFAANMGARIIVVHGGYVEMRGLSRKLMNMASKGERETPKYERTLQKLIVKRDRKVKRFHENLMHGLEQLIPLIEETGVRIGLENLPNFEAIPNEMETEHIAQTFGADKVCYWHDFGHAQIRQNLGLISHRHWLERLLPYLGGVHIHDVIPPIQDHAMPPQGEIDFKRFRNIGESDIVRVFEPSSRASAQDVREGLVHLRNAWQENDEQTENKPEGLDRP